MQKMASETFNELIALLSDYNGAFDAEVGRLTINGVSFERDNDRVPNPKFRPARKVAGKTLQEWQEFARRDDCLDQMVPSDLRQLIKAIT